MIRAFEITFSMNGIIVGIKGFLSLLTAPLVGGPVKSLGAKALPPNHSVLHLCTNTM